MPTGVSVLGKQVEYFLEHVLHMNPPFDTVSPTQKALWRIIKEAILKWEGFRNGEPLP